MKNRLLLISFYFEPDHLVGAFRTSYWANQLADAGWNVTVLTQSKASPTDKVGYKRVVIPYIPRAITAMVRDQGLSWAIDIKQHFQTHNDYSFNYVLISGGPFLQMLLTNYFKSRLSAKVILDFRDPFAINPRFAEHPLKRWVKSQVERYVCSRADHIITVNSFTAELLQADQNKISTIDNGYDESKFGSLLGAVPHQLRVPNGQTVVIHTGKVDVDRNPNELIKAVNNLPDFKLKHFGNSIDFSPIGPNISLNAPVAYSEVIQEIQNSDIGIVLTNGARFVSTTKIFDYLALNKKILIITEGKLRDGNLESITTGYPNVMWSKNSEKEIIGALCLLSSQSLVNTDTSRFSRKAGFHQLERLLTQL